MDESGIMFLVLFGRCSVLDEALARPDMGKLDRLLGDFETLCRLLHDCELRTFQVAGVWKIGAEMRAARILALACRERNHAADFAERAQVEPVVPSHVESAVARGD